MIEFFKHKQWWRLFSSYCLNFFHSAIVSLASSLPPPAIAHSLLCVLIHPFLQQPDATGEKKKIFRFFFLSVWFQNNILKIFRFDQCYYQVLLLIHLLFPINTSRQFFFSLCLCNLSKILFFSSHLCLLFSCGQVFKI